MRHSGHVQAKLDPEQERALRAYAEKRGFTVSAAIRALLTRALADADMLDLAAGDLRDAGYRHGVQAGAHDVLSAVGKTIAEMQGRRVKR